MQHQTAAAVPRRLCTTLQTLPMIQFSLLPERRAACRSASLLLCSSMLTGVLSYGGAGSSHLSGLRIQTSEVGMTHCLD
ncbi:hypothetical protein AB205_0073280 [Aquarana catesbeiana]|uniref:Uncharacterized protein n=1 Tax=Aquarana catesbeiana TaxID=8400 RepID=A0A2G9SA14_AQUCT|nr:hypothetical protein AB205_0073280 [Aquarana catesbeiana]